MITLQEANRRMNEKYAYLSDQEHYGDEDVWEDAADGSGDCEDYAIAKLRLLLAEGWPREAFKIGLCWVETGEYHAVLIATEDGEDWVLDNRHPEPTRWQDCVANQGYKFDKFYLLGECVWRAAA